MEDCSKYQDIALAVAKVACLASCATQDADARTLYTALGAGQGTGSPKAGAAAHQAPGLLLTCGVAAQQHELIALH